MGPKCALIVDDSRTARETLSRMLGHHGLRVETAESAEAALEFLAHHRPHVIFMDHQMPGMDGFQAVKAIKENPATATIPVMMYTSQSGELYVGQARALGAVGVLPKQIKPVEVEEILKSLHLLGEPERPEARNPDIAAALPGVEALNEPADWSDLHRWLQQMLADHNRMLRTDLEDSVARIISEQLAVHNAPAGTGLYRTPGRISFWPGGALILTLAAVAGTFFWLHLTSQARWQEAAQRNLELMAALDSERQTVRPDVVTADPSAAARTAERLAGSVAAIEWSVNQAASYPPDEIPFSDTRLQGIVGLMQRLKEIGFAGRVRLESHVGDFCMAKTGETTWQVAADDVPIEKCDRVGAPPDEARAASARQSLAFANYLAQFTSAGASPIRLELDSFGNSRPIAAYPSVVAGTTAAEWNAAARANQRVEVRLIPDPPKTAAVVP